MYWRIVKRDGKETVKMICPDCLSEAALNHRIEKDGTIRPSVICPSETCTFHRNVKLEEWDRGVFV